MSRFVHRAGVATQMQVGVLKVTIHSKQLCFIVALILLPGNVGLWLLNLVLKLNLLFH